MTQDDRAPQFDPIHMAYWGTADVCRCMAKGKWKWIDGRLTCLRCGKPKYPEPQKERKPWWAVEEL